MWHTCCVAYRFPVQGAGEGTDLPNQLRYLGLPAFAVGFHGAVLIL